jgi:hypothetical protein
MKQKEIFMEYRIKVKTIYNGKTLYYPERKYLFFFWWSICSFKDGRVRVCTNEIEAREVINQYKTYLNPNEYIIEVD